MKPTVAIAGGSRGLGRAIVQALKDDERFEPVIFSRKIDEFLQREIGVPFIAASYTDEASLVTLLENNNIEIVISTMNTGPDPAPEHNLIRASDRSKVTRRYISNLWSAVVFTEEHSKSFPLATIRFSFINLLKTTSLEWTTVHPGIFMDFYIPSLPTFGTETPLCIDMSANIAGIPGSGNEPVVLTHNFDIGKFMAPLLSLDKWEKKYFIVGDKTTFNEMVALAEEAKGVKFKVTYDSAEDLKAGKITELPGFKALSDMMGGGEQAKAMVKMIVSQMSLQFQNGAMDYKDGPFLNEMFPEIKPLKFQEGLAKAFPKA